MSVEGPREIELKLDVDPSAAAALAAELTERFGEPRSSTLTSVYYDTPDETLRAAGVTLRIRTGESSGPIQTVKRAIGLSAGFFDRDEWECRLLDETPDLAAFARTPAGSDLAIDLARLSPAFETVVERSVWQVASAEYSVELAFDKGLVAARGRTEEFAEFELELKRGEPQALFSLLRRLDPAGRLRPGVQTKSERGYALASDTPRRAFKAEPVQLTKDMTTADAFRAIAHACLRHFWLNEPMLVGARAPEALHQTRVALRRLRSALSLFKSVATDRDAERFKSALQDVSRHLGDARNLDVYLESAVTPEVAGMPADGSPSSYLVSIEKRREKAYTEVIERLRGPAFREMMIELLVWIEAGPWRVEDDPDTRARREVPVRTFAARILTKHRRRVRRRGRHLERLDPHQRHRVRIEAKKLRYAAEFFAGLARGRKARRRQAIFTDALENLQEQLGALNDISTGHAIAHEFAHEEPSLQGGLATALDITAQQEARTRRLLAQAAEAHAAFAGAKRFWSSWPDA